MTYDELMKTLKICSVGNTTDCDACPLHSSHDCHTIMARNALAELERQEKALIMQEKKMSEIAKKYDPIEIVMTALDKGDQHIMVSPDGSVSMWPDTPTKGWISVNDAKPDKNGDYLVYRGHAVSEDWLKTNDANWLVGICPWNEKMGGWYKMRDNEVDKTVTHWMKLPTAPEGWGCDAAD